MADWDVEKYKTDYEPSDHWELRKSFMLAHKDVLPENELVSMAHVFTNIEFLNCRYPDETMERVAELAKGVVEKFREARRHKLKRTFVAASDAASSKAKGLSNAKPVTRQAVRSEGSKSLKIVKQPGSFENVVLFDFHDCRNIDSANILTRSLQLSRISFRFDIEQTPTNMKKCSLIVNDVVLAEAEADTKAKSKGQVCQIALDKLRKICYTIKITSTFNCDAQQVDIDDVRLNDSHVIQEDNVGSKMMRLMGWTGGGLGRQEQGRTEPVQAAANVRRAGLGIKFAGDKHMSPEFSRRVKQCLQRWQNSATDCLASDELRFAADFTSQERAEIHRIARSLNLKSKSYGKGDERQLLITRSLSPWEIIADLAAVGGQSGKYLLISPQP